MNDRASFIASVDEILSIFDSSDARIHKIREKNTAIDAAIKESSRFLEKVDKDLENMEVRLKEVLGGGDRIGEAGSGDRGTVGAGDGVQLNVEVEVAEKEKDKTAPEVKDGHSDVIGGGILSGVVGLGDGSGPVGVGDGVQPDLRPKVVVRRDDVAEGGFHSTVVGSEGGSNAVGVGDGVVSSIENEEEYLTPEVKDGSAGALGDESDLIRVGDDVRLDMLPQEEEEAGGVAGRVSERTPLIRSDTGGVTYTKCRCYTLGSNRWMTIALFIFGAICSFISPYFLTAHRVTWLSCGATAAVSFLILSFTGLTYRDGHHILRDTPTLFMRAMYVVHSSALTITVGALLQTSQDYYSGFTFIGLAVFCLVEIVQPTCDYGILQLFVCLPLQIAILLHGFTFHWSYVPGAIIPVVCLISQLYFVQHFDEIYRENKAKNKAKFKAVS